MHTYIFTHIFQHSPMGIALTCADTGLILDVNEKFAHILNQKPEDLQGQSVYNSGFLSDIDIYDEIKQEICQHGQVNRKQILVIDQSKKKKYVDIYVTKISPAQAGEYIKKCKEKFSDHSKVDMSSENILIIYVYDLTSEVQSKAQIQKKADRLQDIVDATPSPLAIVSKKTFRILFANQFLAELFGYSTAELKGMVVQNLFRMPATGLKPLWKKILKEGQLKQKEFIALTKSGGQIPVLTSLRFFDYKGEAALVGTVFDIRQRKKNEEEIRKLNEAIEQSSASIVITDKQGNIEYVNPQFTRQTGYEYSEAIGQNPRILKSGKQPKEYYRKMWHKIQAGEIWQGEFQNRKKNGDIYWELATIAPVKNSQGKITHYIAIKDEITKRKKMEQELRLAKELAEKGMKAKSQFLATMSHEIRTPMNGIMGMAHLALTECNNPQVREYLETIDFSGQHLLRVINDILDVSKIEAGKMELEKKPFELRALIRRLYMSFSEEARKKDIGLEYRVADQVPNHLLGDPGRISQILFNVLGNAVKFTQQGRVELLIDIAGESETHELLKNKQEENRNFIGLHIQIRDTGIGIPQDKIKDIFQSFTQVHSGHKHNFDGTGLGLTISQKLTQLMHGWISVDSVYGEGSVFHIWIGLKQDHGNHKQTEQKSESGLDQPLPSIKIIVAEDNAVNQKVAKAFFKQLGLQIDIVHNGLELLKRLQEKEYDIIFMDIEMPEMDGIEATKQIRKGAVRGTRHDIPIVALTAYVMPEEQKRFFQAGIDDLIAKPINIHDVRRVLHYFFPGPADNKDKSTQ